VLNRFLFLRIVPNHNIYILEQDNIIDMGSLRTHFNNLSNQLQLPTDPYSHATLLLETSKTSDYQDKMNFTSKRAKLANLGTDKLLELEQDEVRCLIDFYDMAEVDLTFKDFFETRYAKWINSIDLTRGRENAERKQQARVGVTPNTEATYPGYGADQQQFQQEQEQGKKDFFSQLFNKNKRQGGQ